MGSAGKQGAGVADQEPLHEEEAEKNGDPGEFDPGAEFRRPEAAPEDSEREEHPSSFDPGLETGYLRRGPRDHSLEPELGAAPFDPGTGTGYDSRRARRAAKKHEREERKRREREEREARESAEQKAELEREAEEQRSAAQDEQARKDQERRRREAIIRARQERAERLRALREASEERLEGDEDGEERVTTAREEYRRREALADKLRAERIEREREERERRAQIEQEREERELEEHERREARRAARWERWRRDRDRIEDERQERELRERRQRAKRGTRARRRRPAKGRPPQSRPPTATTAQPSQRAAAPKRSPAQPRRAAGPRVAPVPTRPARAPAPVRRIRRPKPARPAQIRLRPTGGSLWRPTAIAGIAIAAVLVVVGAMGSILGLPVPIVGGSSSATLAETSGLTLDAGTPAGLPRGPFFPLINSNPDFGEAAAKFGASRSGHKHEGQDMFAPVGTPEVAVRDGIVLDGGGGKSFYSYGGGNTFAMYSPVDDRSYVYLHMLHPSPLHAGDQVHAGQVIGQLGCTGSCDGPHLHFEIRLGRVGYGKEGKAIDPLPFLQQWLATQAPAP